MQAPAASAVPKVDSLLPAIGRLSGRGRSSSAAPAAGTIPLATAGRVELCGRALLPPGVDDLVLSIFDDEPTSIIAYFLTTRCGIRAGDSQLPALAGILTVLSNILNEVGSF